MAGETSRKICHAVTHPVSGLHFTLENDLPGTLPVLPRPAYGHLRVRPYPDDANLQFTQTSGTSDLTDMDASGPQHNVIIGSSVSSGSVGYPESPQTAAPCFSAVHIPENLIMPSYIMPLDPLPRPASETLRPSSGILVPPDDIRWFRTSQNAMESPSSPWPETFGDGCVGDSIAGENMLISPLMNRQILSPLYSPSLLPHSTNGPPSIGPTVLTFQLSDNLMQRVDDPENDQLLQSFQDSGVCDDTETDSAGSSTPKSPSYSLVDVVPEAANAIQQGNFDEISVGTSHFPPPEIPHSVSNPIRSSVNQPSRLAGTPQKAKPLKKQKMHKCEECGKLFPRPSGLSTHMNSHSGAKPHKCPIPECNKWFAVRSNAKRHLVKTHGVTVASNETPSTPTYSVGFEQPVVNDVHDSGKQPSRYRWIPQNATLDENNLFSSPAAYHPLVFAGQRHSYDDLGTSSSLQNETDSNPYHQFL